MQKIIFFSTFLVVILRGVTTAQNPYESIGKEMPKGKILTLTNGKYPEIIENDTIVRIGSVMFNTVTGEVVAFLTKDTLHTEYNLEPDVVSRWLSPDPLAKEYANYSPYTFVANNPVKYTDPDGNLIVDQNGNIVVTTNNNSNGQPTRLLVKEDLPLRTTPEGYTRSSQINAIYNDVTIYADNGTPIQAMQFVSATQVVTIKDENGKVIDRYETSVTKNADCSSNCHGFTFAKGQLLINPDQAKKLLENDDYKATDENNAQVVLLNDANGVPQHSGIVNSDGTYNQ
jgi:RHS repeat-associated protein